MLHFHAAEFVETAPRLRVLFSCKETEKGLNSAAGAGAADGERQAADCGRNGGRSEFGGRAKGADDLIVSSIQNDHVRLQRHGFSGEFPEGVGIDCDHGEVDDLDCLPRETGVPTGLHEPAEVIIAHGKTGSGRFAEEDNASHAFGFARGNPQGRRRRHVGSLEKEAGKGRIGGVIILVIMANLLEEPDWTEKSGCVKNPLQGKEKDHWGEDG
ncbi:MAG: hypothetical protein ACO3RK_02340 [Luteolibacter sp.]